MREFIESTIKEAGKIAVDFFERGVSSEIKSYRNDLLTEGDKTVSDFFVKKIQEAYPDHGILTEEMEEHINPEAEMQWIVDPIDGTWNFAHGIPSWAILVALQKNGVTTHAVSYSPMEKMFLYADTETKTTLNGKTVQVNSYDTIEDAVGQVYLSPHWPLAEEYIHALTNALRKKFRYRDATSASLASLVANGTYEFYMSNAGEDYDHLAPKFLIERAGGKVTNWKGEPWERGMQNLVASNGVLHDQLLELFK